MGIFKSSQTPPPPASEASHDHAGVPISNNHTGTTYAPTNEMPAPSYTQQPYQSQDGIHTAPPPAAHEPYPNEKRGAVNSHQTGYPSDPNLLHNQQQQQPQQQPGQQNAPSHGKNVYNVARPLHSLEKRSEVVDCPNCGVRELTRTVFVSGGTTQYAVPLPSSPNLSLPSQRKLDANAA